MNNPIIYNGKGSQILPTLVHQNEKGVDVTTSLKVASKFGKEHKNVLRDIESLSCSTGFRRLNFELSFNIRELPNGGHKNDPYYEMTKDGFTFLVMGYTGEKAGEFKEMFIAEFNKREMMLKDDDYILMRSQQILQKRVEVAEQKIIDLEQTNNYLTNEMKEAAPKIQCFNEYISSSGTYTATQIAKEYGWGAETLNKKLKDLGVQYKQNGQWLLTAKYDGKGYTKSIPRTYTRLDGTTGTQMQTVWTSKGREFIHSLFATN